MVTANLLYPSSVLYCSVLWYLTFSKYNFTLKEQTKLSDQENFNLKYLQCKVLNYKIIIICRTVTCFHWSTFNIHTYP